MSKQSKTLRQVDEIAAAVLEAAATEIRRLHAQRDALLEALKKAEENGCSTVYANEYDECGAKGCCGVVSYNPHADDCWVTTARAVIKQAEENT